MSKIELARFSAYLPERFVCRPLNELKTTKIFGLQIVLSCIKKFWKWYFKLFILISVFPFMLACFQIILSIHFLSLQPEDFRFYNKIYYIGLTRSARL